MWWVGRGFGRLTFILLMIFPQLHAFESCGTTDDFVAELGLILIAAGPVDLLVGVLRLVWKGF